IGLTLVKSLVEMHGGVVTAHSEGPGKGSQFTVRLPIACPQKATAGLETEFQPSCSNAHQAGRPASACLPRRVLVVDDNKDSAESIALLLQMRGHEVRTALDGRSALEMARLYRPDAVLLDIGLPNMDGYEVAKQ